MIQIEHFVFNCFQTRCSVVWDDSGACAFVDPGCASADELSRLTSFVASRGLRPAAIMLTHAHFDHIYGVADLSKEYGGLPVYMHAKEAYTIGTTNPYVCKAYGLPLPDTSFADGSGAAASATSTGPVGPGGPGGPGDSAGPEGATGSPCSAECADSSGATASSGKTGGVVHIAEGDTIEVGGLRFEVIETPGHTVGGVCFYERECGVLFSGDTLFAGAIGRTDHPGGDYDQMMRSILEKLVTLDGSVSVIPGHGPCTDIGTEGMTNPFLLPFNEPYDD